MQKCSSSIKQVLTVSGFILTESAGRTIPLKTENHMHDKEKLLDVRVIERNLRKGLVSQKELDTHLNKLPDMQKEAETLIVEPPDDGAEADA